MTRSCRSATSGSASSTTTLKGARATPTLHFVTREADDVELNLPPGELPALAEARYALGFDVQGSAVTVTVTVLLT